VVVKLDLAVNYNGMRRRDDTRCNAAYEGGMA
jgi:hypothetical protein